jgi:hypothetical protein
MLVYTEGVFSTQKKVVQPKKNLSTCKKIYIRTKIFLGATKIFLGATKIFIGAATKKDVPHTFEVGGTF